MARAMDEFGRFKCAKCKYWLPKDHFCRDRSNPSGLSWKCKQCKSHEARQRREAGGVPDNLNAKQFIKDWKNHSLRELAAIYGRTQPSIITWAAGLRKRGWHIPHKTPGPRKFDRDEFVRLANSMPISDVADKLGLSYGTIVWRIIQCRKEGYNL